MERFDRYFVGMVCIAGGYSAWRLTSHYLYGWGLTTAQTTVYCLYLFFAVLSLFFLWLDRTGRI